MFVFQLPCVGNECIGDSQLDKYVNINSIADCLLLHSFLLPYMEFITSQLGKCSEFQAVSGHCLKCTVTGVHHNDFVSGHGKW